MRRSTLDSRFLQLLIAWLVSRTGFWSILGATAIPIRLQVDKSDPVGQSLDLSWTGARSGLSAVSIGYGNGVVGTGQLREPG